MKETVFLRLVEFHVVHHCNLTCSGCSHFSPQAAKELLTVQQIGRDVELAAARLDPEYVHVLGGEPLLHPGLPEILPVFRTAFPRATIKVVTNGTLLERSPRPLLRALADLDIRLAVSVYPTTHLSQERIAALCAEHGIGVEIWEQSTFLDFLDLSGTSDAVAARAECPMDDACNVRDGYLFPCPVSAWADLGRLPWVQDDGVSLTAGADEIRAVLDRRRLTSCCRFCRVPPVRVPHQMDRLVRLSSERARHA
jgi:GTP 3',8-cyclase